MVNQIEEDHRKSMLELELLMKNYGVEIDDLYLRKDTGGDQSMNALKGTLKDIRDLRETMIFGKEKLISKVKQHELSRLARLDKITKK